MCMSNIESHIPWGSLSSRGLFDGQIPQQGNRTTMALELLTHRETHKDNTTNCCSQFPQACAVMERLLNDTHSIIRVWQKIRKHFEIWSANYQVLLKCLSILLREDSWVIVVVLLLTKPTVSGLSVGTSGRPDCWTDAMTEVLSFSLSRFPGPDATSRHGLRFWPEPDDVSVTPWTNVLFEGDSERQRTDTIVSIWGSGLSFFFFLKNWEIWIKHSAAVYLSLFCKFNWGTIFGRLTSPLLFHSHTRTIRVEDAVLVFCF